MEANLSGGAGGGEGWHCSATTVVLLNGLRAVALSSQRHLPGPCHTAIVQLVASGASIGRAAFQAWQL